MSEQGDFDNASSRRKYTGPYGYTPTHPVPTIQKCKERQEQRDTESKPVAEEKKEEDDEEEEEESKTHKAFKAIKKIIKDEDNPDESNNPYGAENRNANGGHHDAKLGEEEMGDRASDGNSGAAVKQSESGSISLRIGP